MVRKLHNLLLNLGNKLPSELSLFLDVGLIQFFGLLIFLNRLNSHTEVVDPLSQTCFVSHLDQERLR